MLYGRLARDISYDDCVYFADAATRLSELRASRTDFLRGYAASPPHSPFCTFLAMAGFGILGLHDWVPYAANGIVLAALTVMIAFLLSPVPSPAARAFLLMGFMFVPFSYEAINVFRPEFSVSLFTSVGVVSAAIGVYQGGRIPAFCLSGFAFGLALLSKTPFFPFTLMIAGCTWLTCVAAWWLLYGNSLCALGFILGRAMASCAIMVLTAAPHYAVALPNIIRYIQINQFGDVAYLWRMQGTLADHMLYFLVGGGGLYMLGTHLYLFGGILIGGAVFLLVSRRRREAVLAGIIFLNTVVAYLFFSLNPVKQYCFGWAFQILFVTLAAVSSTALVRAGLHRGWISKGATLSACGLFLLVSAIAQSPNGQPASAKTEGDRRMGSRVFAELTKLFSAPHSKLKVYIASSQGTVNPGTLKWLAVKRTPPSNIDISADDFSPDLEEDLGLARQADAVVTCDEGIVGGTPWLPSAKLLPDFNKSIFASPEFDHFATLPASDGRKVYIYTRNVTSAALPYQ